MAVCQGDGFQVSLDPIFKLVAWVRPAYGLLNLSILVSLGPTRSHPPYTVHGFSFLCLSLVSLLQIKHGRGEAWLS